MPLRMMVMVIAVEGRGDDQTGRIISLLVRVTICNRCSLGPKLCRAPQVAFVQR